MKTFSHFRTLQTMNVWPPHSAIVDVPATARFIHQDNRLVVVCVHLTIADLLRNVTGTGVGVELCNVFNPLVIWGEGVAFPLSALALILNLFSVKVGEVICRRCYCRAIDFFAVQNGVADGDCSVSAITGSSIPLVPHQARRAENPVNLLLYASAPETQNRD